MEKLFIENAKLIFGQNSVVIESPDQNDGIQYLFNNQLTSLSESLWNLSSLRTLYLSNNNLTSISESISS